MTVAAKRNGLGLTRWGLAALAGSACLLLVPLVAMQFTREVNWTVGDFAVMAVMLGGASMALELLVRRGDGLAYRAGAAVALGAAFLLVWVNLAVGIIGSESNPANLLFVGVLAVGAIGAALGRFRPAGMARAILATAAAQALAGGLALAMGWGMDGHAWPRDVIGASGLFVALWLVAAWLFKRAAARSVQ